MNRLPRRCPMRSPEVLALEKKPLANLANYRFRKAQESDYERLITRSTLIQEQSTGRVSIVYLELEDDCTEVVDILRGIQYDADERTSGFLSQSRIFGYRPRITIRDDFCTVAALAHENARAHQVVTSYAEKVAMYYQQFNPQLYAHHQQLTDKVLPEWKIEHSVFTSGIINKNNPLPYHFDTGNFKHVWSNMLVFKHDISGGYLAVPEYDCGFFLRHNSLLMFDGQNILHGVTPITMLSADAYR